MVKVYSRPHKHRKVNFVPNDFFRPNSLIGDEPGWFSTFPINKTSLSRAGKIAFYRTQRQAPERKEYLVQGEYDLVSFRPEGTWSAQNFLLEMKNPNYKAKANSIVFGEVPININQKIKFESQDLKDSFQPLVIVRNIPPGPEKVNVYLDGRLVISQDVKLGNVHIRLPIIKPGLHTLKISAHKDAKSYVNFQIPTGAIYLKKIAYLLEKDKSLKFNFEKRNSRETNLSIRVFQNENQLSHVRLSTDITDLRSKIADALSTSTIPHQEWNIGPYANHSDFIFNNLEEVNTGTPFSVFFGEDFSQKNTDINFKLTEGDRIYLGIFELAPRGEIEYNDSKISTEKAQ